MTNIMDQMYNGELYIMEQVLPKEEEYTRVGKQLENMMEKMQKEFPKEYYDLVDEAFEVRAVLDNYEFEEFFKTGLSIGLTLIREAEENLLVLREGNSK